MQTQCGCVYAGGGKVDHRYPAAASAGKGAAAATNQHAPITAAP